MQKLLAVTVALSVGLAACSKCGGKPEGISQPQVTRWVPRASAAAVVVPSLQRMGEKLQLLQSLKVVSFAAQLQGANDAEQLIGPLMRQVGVDLRSAESMGKVGLDASRGFAIVLLTGGELYTVLPVKDEAKLKELIASLARARLGAGEEKKEQKDGTTVFTYAQTAGGPARLGVAFHAGHAFVAPDAPAEKLVGFASLPADGALAKDPTWSAALGRLPSAADALAYLPPGSPYARVGNAKGAAVAALGVTREAMTLNVDVPAGEVQAALGPLNKREGAELLGYLPADAFAFARYSGEPTSLAPHIEYAVGPYLDRVLRANGFEFNGEVLGNLKPGVAVSVSLSPEVKLAGGMPALDVRRTNPFRFVQLVGVAEVKDAEKAKATLARLPPIAPKFGAVIEPQEREGKQVYLTRYVQGEGVHFALVDGKAAMASPLSRFDAVVKTLSAKPAAGPARLSDAAVKQLFDGNAIAGVIDLRRLSDSVRALPNEAWGVGGFAMKATTLRWLEATDDLEAITFSMGKKDGAAQLQLSLRLSPK